MFYVQDIPLNMEKIEANRNFTNKLWNCCKFVTDNALKDAESCELSDIAVTGPMRKEEFEKLLLPERYIISKCHSLVDDITKDIEKYQLEAAGSKVSCVFLTQNLCFFMQHSLKTKIR